MLFNLPHGESVPAVSPAPGIFLELQQTSWPPGARPVLILNQSFWLIPWGLGVYLVSVWQESFIVEFITPLTRGIKGRRDLPKGTDQ